MAGKVLSPPPLTYCLTYSRSFFGSLNTSLPTARALNPPGCNYYIYLKPYLFLCLYKYITPVLHSLSLYLCVQYLTAFLTLVPLSVLAFYVYQVSEGKWRSHQRKSTLWKPLDGQPGMLRGSSLPSNSPEGNLSRSAWIFGPKHDKPNRLIFSFQMFLAESIFMSTYMNKIIIFWW